MGSRVLVMLFVVAACLLLASCMTPRQAEALMVLQDLVRQGVLSQEQFERLAAALSTATWVTDVIAIGSGLLGGTGAYVATNIRRNALRKARGEPVAPIPHA